MTKALATTKQIAYLMLMPVPPLFLTVPAVLLATLVAAVVVSLAALALSFARARAAARGGGGASGGAPAPYLAPAGAANALLFLLAFWLAAALAVTALWAGAILVSEKSTADAAVTLRSVDPAIHRLIYQASGGAINGTESGFIVTVGEGKGPKRDVDIGKSSCSLFCFVFARAMMSDSMDCYCDVPIMAKIHDAAKAALKRQLLPAAACSAAALGLALGLLMCGAAQFGAADAARRAARRAAAAAAAAAGAGGKGEIDYAAGGAFAYGGDAHHRHHAGHAAA